MRLSKLDTAALALLFLWAIGTLTFFLILRMQAGQDAFGSELETVVPVVMLLAGQLFGLAGICLTAYSIHDRRSGKTSFVLIALAVGVLAGMTYALMKGAME